MTKTKEASLSMKRLSKLVMCGLVASPLLLSAPAQAGGKGYIAPEAALALTDDIKMAGTAFEPDTKPTLLAPAKPRYPLDAIAENTEGWVVVELDITEKGIPANAKILASDAGKVFHRTSLAALKKLRFAPATHKGEPVPVTGKRYKITYALAS